MISESTSNELLCEMPATRDQKKLARQFRGTDPGLLDQRQIAMQVGPGLSLGFKIGGEPDDTAENVVKVMRDAPREHPDRLHFFGEPAVGILIHDEFGPGRRIVLDRARLPA